MPNRTYFREAQVDLPSAVPSGITALHARDSFLTRFALSLLWVFVATIPMENAFVLPGIGTASRLVGFVAFPACLAAIAERGRLRGLSPLHWIMAAHVSWICLTCLWTADRPLTLQMMGTYGQLLGMVWLFWELAVRGDQQVSLLRAYTWGSTVSAAATLTRSLWSGAENSRYAAFNFNPNDLGLILAISVPISFYLAAIETRPFWIWLTRSQLIIAIAAVVLTSARGAVLALCGGLMLSVLNFPLWGVRQRKGVFLALALGLASAVLIVPANSWNRLATTLSEIREGTLNQRTLIWNAGWEQFRQTPFLGVGAGAFAVATEPRLAPPREGELVAHSVYLSVLFETGVVGFGIYLTLLLAMVLAVVQMPRLTRNLWLITLLTWGIGVASLTWEYRKPTWFVFGMLTAQTASWIQARRRYESERQYPVQLAWRSGTVSQ